MVRVIFSSQSHFVQYHCWKPMFWFWLISVIHSILFLGACVHLILSILNAGVTHTNGTTEAGAINSVETQCLPVFHTSRTISSCCQIFQLLYFVYIAYQPLSLQESIADKIFQTKTQNLYPSHEVLLRFGLIEGWYRVKGNICRRWHVWQKYGWACYYSTSLYPSHSQATIF